MAADAPAIASVHVASWQRAYAGLLPADFLAALSVEERTARWTRTIDGLDRDHLVVVEEPPVPSGTGAGTATVAGFAHVGPSGDADAGPATGELYTIYLHPDAWGKGLGRALNDAALDLLTVDGYVRATLWMLSTNDRARRFYGRQGWAPIEGERTQEFGGQVVVDHRLGRRLPR